MKKTVAVLCIYLASLAFPLEHAAYAQTTVNQSYCPDCESTPCACAPSVVLPEGPCLPCPPVRKRKRGITWREVSVVISAVLVGAAILLTSGNGGQPQVEGQG